MFERLFVPTDGSGPATAALELAVKLAPDSATVHLLYVDEDHADATDRPGEVGTDILAHAREIATTAGASVESDVRRGTPRDRILEYADEHDTDLIVMGSHGRRRVGRLALGDETQGVVRDAPMPVLVVRASDDIRKIYPYDRVLVPTDGSEHATAALEHGIETAADVGATLHLLSVVNITRYGSDAETDRLVAHLEANARTALDTAAATATERGVDVRTAVTVGTVHREIVSYADREGVDLLVLGTHGRSGVDRELLGSVTERVLRLAPAPVFTVRLAESGDRSLE
ncbi:universal stress protein [Natronorubrum aibiense]|uniref:Universal stress protein n=1 Tax=Natronorubrum aibiense TaxID=348826 RepID=A0A5P9P934_9EURY|nr:universal stress protein [Natronorubrum aibiense]QFU84618.1 universal stress protein [Natronorubrum aibiense]